jgi:hypothetical protein
MTVRIAKVALLAAIYLAACLAPVLGYYAYGKLTFEGYFCRPFGVVDDEIGWTIAPNASSCIGGRAPFESETPWFEAPVFSDANGFRSARPGTATSQGGILATGDSWTFGYGVRFEDSYPGQLQRSGVPVVVAASPAYGSAQALMLTERWLARLRPRAIVYLDLGLWDRSACRGAHRPTAILKPCYWQAPGETTAELVVPPAGRVRAFARFGVIPGGMLGAGEDSWTYFLVSRPVALGYQVLARAGIVPGFGHDFRAVGVDETAIERGTLAHLARIAAKARVPVLLLDPHGAYAPLIEGGAGDSIHYVGAAEWDAAVGKPASRLAPALAAVPHDGHFGPGTNALIAAFVRKKLQDLGICFMSCA